MIEVIDGFLPDLEYDILRKALHRYDFPWYYDDYVNDKQDNDGLFQFTHIFYKNFRIFEYEYYEKFMIPIFDRLNANAVVRCKANLTTRMGQNIVSKYHVDINPPPSNLKTGILYLSTTNGETQFESGEKIECVENRMVVFDGTIPHASTFQTDEKRRIVLNFNWL